MLSSMYPRVDHNHCYIVELKNKTLSLLTIIRTEQYFIFLRLLPTIRKVALKSATSTSHNSSDGFEELRGEQRPRAQARLETAAQKPQVASVAKATGTRHNAKTKQVCFAR